MRLEVGNESMQTIRISLLEWGPELVVRHAGGQVREAILDAARDARRVEFDC